MRGTPLQKVSFVNNYIYSKIRYVAQSIKLEAAVMKTIPPKTLNFIWAGQNERPVRALNFRSKELGGLGLVCPDSENLTNGERYNRILKIGYTVILILTLSLRS